MPWERHVGRRLKLRDLYILMTVVEARGMGKAAARLNMSQPAVSNAIAGLEQAIGVRLLDRNRQGVEPTPYGHALLKRGVAVFDELRQGVKDIECLADPTAGELRIGCPEVMAAGPVFTVIERLSRQYPRFAFQVVTGDAETLAHELSERNVELVISRITEAVADEHMAVENLFEDSLVVAAGIANPWTRRRRVELAELVNEPWTLPPSDSFLGAPVADAFCASGLKPPHATVVTLSVNMRDKLLATGRYLTALPSFSLRAPGRNPALKALPVELPNTRRQVGIITLRNRSSSALAELFLDGMRGVAKSLTVAREVAKPLTKKK